MHQFKIMARILLILPIINFAFALPIAVQETRQLRGDVVPDGGADAAITMSAKRGDEVGKQWDTYSESLSGKPESSSAAHPSSGPARSESDYVPINEHAPPQTQSPTSTAPEDGSMDPPQTGTSEIQQVSQEPLRSPSLDHYVVSPGSEASSDHYVVSPGSEASLDHYLASPGSSGSSGSFESYESGDDDRRSPLENSKSFLSKVMSKFKFWRRISGPGPIVDVVNGVGQRGLQGPVDTGAYVSASSPESQTF
jgi:hypothetical protein